MRTQAPPSPLPAPCSTTLQLSEMFTQGLIPVALVFSVSFLTYYNSLFGGFVFDDHRAILTNDDLDPGKTSLWRLFENDFWGGHMSRTESHKSYRPLTVLTYRYLNYWFAGLEPFSYHLVNVFLHCAASVLFWCLCQRVLGGRRKWSLYAAILFAVHSVHTEAVSLRLNQYIHAVYTPNLQALRLLPLQVASVVGRAEVLACVFFLLSLLCYMKGVSTSRGRLLVPTAETQWHYVLLGVLMSACSLLSKEQGITALGVCAAFDVFLNWDSIWNAVARNKHSRKAVAVEEKMVESDSSSQNSHRTILPNGNHVHSVGITCSHGNERSSIVPDSGKLKNSNAGTPPLQSLLSRLGSWRTSLSTICTA